MSSLGELFAGSAERYPERPALVVGDTGHDYRSLYELAGALAELIVRVDAGETPLCAVHGKRSLWAYAGILGTLLAGRGYVPLNPGYPPERTRRMLELCGASTLIADGAHLEALREVLVGFPGRLTVILPENPSLPAWTGECSQHRILCAPQLTEQGGGFAPRGPARDSIAYLLFTSGTTGTPKGIGIRQENVLAYLSAIIERYDVGPEDRFSQNFELTFDLSVHDMFVCWSRGACLCVPSQRATMAPARFIRDRELTFWFSTPSSAALMSKLHMLRAGAFPTLSWSLFCGEPLPAQLADAWQGAAPHSTLENLYGPTEATIACTAYTQAGAAATEAENGLVPIGRPFGTTRVAVIDEEGRPVAAGAKGELVLGGGQLAPGYWRDPERTSKAFVTLPSLEPEGPWYRTGDLARFNAKGDLLYHGRMDDQIKIAGHRVELQEVEAVAREIGGSEWVVAVGWPRTASGADGIILFITETRVSDAEIRQHLTQRLPEYMIPGEIHRLESMPLNPSGKVDRKQLVKMREGAG